jgi:hypothetical protein
MGANALWECPLVEEREPFSADDLPVLLDLLFDHRMGVIQDFLRDKKQPFTGTKDFLRQRVVGYVEEKTVSPEELIGLLDHVEGWGNQHIYLYRSPESSARAWDTEAKAREVLQANGKEALLNRRCPLLLPAVPKLCSVEWAPDRVRFVWVEKRPVRERVKSEDLKGADIGRDADLEFDAYRRRISRGIVAFDWDLVSGHAALLIQCLPSGNDYEAARGRFVAELEPLVEFTRFDRVRVSSAIIPIEQSNEVERRQVEHATDRGSGIVYRSPRRGVDAFSDPVVLGARTATGNKLAGRLGNFYWPIEGEKPRRIHVKLYAADQRIGIFGECSEEEVRHVLSRIRHHCRVASRAG